MFPGKKIEIKGVSYTVPALSLGQLRNGMRQKIDEHDKLVAEGKNIEALLSREEVICAAIKRNHPDFDESLLADYLDMTNTTALWMAVMGLSGFDVGEALAAAKEAETPAT